MHRNTSRSNKACLQDEKCFISEPCLKIYFAYTFSWQKHLFIQVWYSLCNLRREPQCIVMGEGISNDSPHSVHIATTSIKHLVLQHQQSLHIYILACPLPEKTLLIWIVSDNDSLLGLFQPPLPPSLHLFDVLLTFERRVQTSTTTTPQNTTSTRKEHIIITVPPWKSRDNTKCHCYRRLQEAMRYY